DASRTEVERTRALHARTTRAAQWKLTESDWRRYESIMAGPRGLWTPELDPIWVLGIHARSAVERRRFAEMAVEQERARVAGELAFQRAYDEAWDRLYPDRVLVDVARLVRSARQSGESSGLAAMPEMLPGDRLLLFLTPGCEACGQLARRLVDWVLAAKGGLDLYLLDTDAQGVQDWARSLRLPPGPIGEGKVTLNLDAGTLDRLTGGAGSPPLLVRRSLGQFAALPLEGLLKASVR
ncbi:MAG: TIGR03759 family integrating conjugative element protein, partial [Candidatus Competibacteraceae bacterium]|nr:TIGR03759 family integrating conjugative element protein [Candidatus Competibacteraceae bacterium]